MISAARAVAAVALAIPVSVIIAVFIFPLACWELERLEIVAHKHKVLGVLGQLGIVLVFIIIMIGTPLALVLL